MPYPTAPLDAARVRAAVASTRFADIRYFAETASTNLDAQAMFGTPGAAGATFVAEFQTAGSGRKGRRWFAPPGTALLFTTILPEPVAAAALWAVPFWIALCVARAIEQVCGVALDLVWPNDFHVKGGKAGGILSVARISGDDAWVGCGIGLNVVRPADDPDLATLQPQPVFLADLAPMVEREALLAQILHVFDQSFAGLRDPEGVAQQWAQRARLAGTIYRYRTDADGIERDGIAQRLGPHGTLVVCDAGGERSIDMADVRVIGHTR